MSINEKHVDTATFAAGCFWGVEVTFCKMAGVVDARVGYCGGHVPNPSYEKVCTGMTGHAESVEVLFDPSKISYQALLDIFWNSHDPTQLNRQGPDTGSQYRSVIFYHNATQKKAALASCDVHQKRLGAPIVTEIIPACSFYPAEEYHQRYLEKRGAFD